MKRLQKRLAACLAAAMVLGLAAPSAGALEGPAYAADASAFVDLGGHWAREKIDRWARWGLVSGIAWDRFDPDGPLTRAQLFAIMNRLQKNTRRTDVSMYTDVLPGAWYYGDIEKAVAAGIARGANGKMRPDDPITRQEVAAVFTRVLAVSDGSAGELSRFRDAGQIADWARGAVSAAVAHGFLSGYPGGTFGGGNTMTRAELIAMLDSSFAGYYSAPGAFREDVRGNAYISADGVSLEGKITGTIYLSPNLTDGVLVNGIRVSQNTAAAALPSPGGNEKPSETPSKENTPAPRVEKNDKKHTSGGFHRRPNLGGSSGGGRPIGIEKPGGSTPGGGTPAVTDSPDRAEIIAQMTNITDGFSIRELPYETRECHPDHFEEKSHPFSSMYCSVGRIPDLVRQYYQGDPCAANPDTGGSPAAAGKKAGTYYEKEVLMSGRANVYGLHTEGVNVPVIQTRDADYTTRLLIHYPTAASEFSGRVFVDILNASSGVDLEDVFRRSYENMIRRGDIYIGVTSKASTAQALKNFNSTRYKDLDWCVRNADRDKDWTTTEGSFENGLVWDMLSQLGTLLKEDPGQLFDPALAEKIRSEGRSYLMGQSQSHMYLNTYLDVFYPYINNARSGGGDLWDGYLGLVGGKAVTALSTGVTVTGSPDFTRTDEPYIAIMSGFETAMRLAGPSGGWYYSIPDGPMNRLYEVTSAPHACPTSAILPNNYEIAAAKPDGTSRDLKKYTGDHIEGDVHLDQFVTAALENLDLWVTAGTPAPANAVMHGDLDRWGNRTGGLRSPKIEAPVAAYYDKVIGTGNARAGTEGSMVYFTNAELAAAYPGGYAEYAAQFQAAADKLLAERYIIREDYEAWLTDCSNNRERVFGAAETARASLTNGVTLRNVTPTAAMETMFNSTAMSISAKYGESWDAVAPEWAKSFAIAAERGSNYIRLSDPMVLAGHAPILYEEKEIFADGTANLYALAPQNEIRVKTTGLPYTNRMIVRTPADPADFTGKVWVDNLNASDKFDSEALWRRAGAMIMNNGDAYIGISSKPLTIRTLQLFGEQVGRDDYRQLSWESPKTYIFSSFKRENLEGHKNGTYRDSEIIRTDIGLLWDILAQAGYAAKEPANWGTLFNLDSTSGKRIHTYLFGQSQSGFNAATYALFQQLLEEQAGGSLPYDGILTMASTQFPARSLNQSDRNIPKTEGCTVDMGGYFGTVDYYLPQMRTPFFFASGESDRNPALFRQAAESGRFPHIRYFEMAGVPHSDNNAPSFPTNDVLSKAVTGTSSGAESKMNYLQFREDGTYQVKDGGSDINANMFVRGLLAALDRAANGAALPDSQFIQTPGTETANADGGLQSPQVSVPLHIYHVNGTMTPVAEVPFTADAYLEAFHRDLAALEADGWILPIDVQYMSAYAERMAKRLDLAASVKSVPTVVEQPYDAGVTYHDRVIPESHAFNSMYCSNGRETKHDTHPEPVRFDTDYGYEEHEFFLSGQANTYRYDKQQKKLSIVDTGIDYTTRALVRYPQQSSRFNGTVVIDLMNITAGYENEDLWRRSYRYLMETGYGYVGLTYSSTGVQSLKQFDADRYANLKWYEGSYRNAIDFDVISQLGSLLRTAEGEKMLGGRPIERVILTAQSSSAYYLNGYLHAFDPILAEANGGAPLFDGYINIVGSALGIAIENPDDYGDAFVGEFPQTTAPMVALMSEFEASAPPSPFAYPRVPDKDNFWLYETAGTPHSDPMSPILPNFAELTKANVKGRPITDKEYADGEFESDLQLDPIVTGALDNLVRHIQNPAFRMPSAENIRIRVGETDAYGNTLGGIRMPQLEAPLARYLAKASKPDGSPNPGSTNGSMIYLGWEDLTTLYGSGVDAATADVDTLFTEYKALFAAIAKFVCDDGFIRTEEKDSLIAWSEKQRPVFAAAKDAFDNAATASLTEAPTPDEPDTDTPDTDEPDTTEPTGDAERIPADSNPTADGADALPEAPSEPAEPLPEPQE